MLHAMRRFPRLALALLAAAALACSPSGEVVRLDPSATSAHALDAGVRPPITEEEDLSPRLLRRFAPIDAETPAGPLVDLGRMLYYEPRLSRDGTISCNSCHPLDDYGATHSAVSTGISGFAGTRNAPTTYNAAREFRQFWDGRAESLEAQALGPIENPREMGSSTDDVVRLLEGLPEYQTAFARAFPQQPHPVSGAGVATAIAAFERGLATPARWDRYLRGDRSALSAREKEGAKLFANLGCMVCHTGADVGGSMFERLGAHEPWPNQRDHGRRDVTHDPADDMTFKVPSLRNVARTAPYFHDGSTDRLDQAVRMMARHQLGTELTDAEVGAIVAWLQSLTGEIPSGYVARPTLPPARTR